MICLGTGPGSYFSGHSGSDARTFNKVKRKTDKFLCVHKKGAACFLKVFLRFLKGKFVFKHGRFLSLKGISLKFYVKKDYATTVSVPVVKYATAD
jgi:hypothetical protein